MNLLDILDLYAMEHDSDNMFLMFEDYVIDERIDKDTMNRVVLKDLGAMRPITTDSNLFKILLDTFFNKYSYNITQLVDTMYLEYNPLYTKDLHRELDEGIHKETDETEYRHSVGDIDNTDTYDTNTDQTDTGTSITENETSAYDSSTYQPKDKSTTTPNLRTDNDVHHSGTTTSDIVSTVDTDKDIEEQHDRDLDEHIYGKDGDTSYQTLIEQQRKVAEFNIFNWIIQRMREELFLLVY